MQYMYIYIKYMEYVLYKVMCIYGCVEYGCMCKAIHDVMCTISL